MYDNVDPIKFSRINRIVGVSCVMRIHLIFQMDNASIV